MAGSSSETPDTGDIDDPRQLATDARQTALEAFDDAADIDDVVERANVEQDAAVSFAQQIAKAVHAGYAEAHARTACGQISDIAEYYTKSALSELVEDEIAALESDSDGRRPFDEVLEDDLNEVVIVRTTDAKQSTIYRWQFDGGSVETTATAETRTHFSWSDFRDEYFDVMGEDPAKPIKDRRGGEEWREFIVSLVEERGREVSTRGPRSSAVDGLKNHIRRSKAYADIQDMVERDGIRIDDPPEENPTELWIPNASIKRICDEFELNTVRELQLELDARGLTRDRVQGVSESTFVNNDKVTYWVVDASIADPGEYVEDPVDPAEQVAQEESDDEDNDDDDSGYGMMGSVGGGGDE
jgi:hypothetical protein